MTTHPLKKHNRNITAYVLISVNLFFRLEWRGCQWYRCRFIRQQRGRRRRWSQMWWKWEFYLKQCLNTFWVFLFCIDNICIYSIHNFSRLNKLGETTLTMSIKSHRSSESQRCRLVCVIKGILLKSTNTLLSVEITCSWKISVTNVLERKNIQGKRLQLYLWFGLLINGFFTIICLYNFVSVYMWVYIW